MSMSAWISPRSLAATRYRDQNSAEVGNQALHACARTCRELLGLVHAELHQQRAGVGVGHAAVPDARRDLLVETGDLLEHLRGTRDQ